MPIADIDPNMRGRCAFLDFDDGTLDLVACTDAHDGLRTVEPRSIRRGHDSLLIEERRWDYRPG
jgi:hypothetical protein